MKMNFSKNKKEPKEISYKKERLNPHSVWIVLVFIFIFFIICELIFFTWFFFVTANKLDENNIPELKTNALKINSITKIIENIEKATNDRMGEISSQKAE